MKNKQNTDAKDRSGQVIAEVIDVSIDDWLERKGFKRFESPRIWAKRNDFKVGTKGRLSNAVNQAYTEAHR
ncbi:MAG: hypothetical protein FWD74_00635 [Actinomycetia bacterium]|nr:hypothetical protein [Actinomycetes bacterium]